MEHDDNIDIKPLDLWHASPVKKGTCEYDITPRPVNNIKAKIVNELIGSLDS